MGKPLTKPSLSSERARWFQQGAICGALAAISILMLLQWLFAVLGAL